MATDSGDKREERLRRIEARTSRATWFSFVAAMFSIVAALVATFVGLKELLPRHHITALDYRALRMASPSEIPNDWPDDQKYYAIEATITFYNSGNRPITLLRFVPFAFAYSSAERLPISKCTIDYSDDITAPLGLKLIDSPNLFYRQELIAADSSVRFQGTFLGIFSNAGLEPSRTAEGIGFCLVPEFWAEGVGRFSPNEVAPQGVAWPGSTIDTHVEMALVASNKTITYTATVPRMATILKLFQ